MTGSLWCLIYAAALLLSLSLTFPALQFSFYGLADQVGALLALVQNGIHTRQRALWEPRRDLLVVDLLSAHDRDIADITYCYKRENT